MRTDDFPKQLLTSGSVLTSIEKFRDTIQQSDYISRDLSWLKFNERVLDQVQKGQRNLFERLKFLAITSSNLDEFFTIRIGSLSNYLDYHKERIDYSGLREVPFRKALLSATQQFTRKQDAYYQQYIEPLFAEHQIKIADIDDLNEQELEQVKVYFERTLYPMLTPMLYDYTHTFPVLIAKTLIFGVITKTNDEEQKKLSFVQIPHNLPRFYVIERPNETVFLPIEEIVRLGIPKLYRNVEIESTNLFRITRNGDFTLEESDDIESDFVDEIKQKIKNRRLGRVVRMEIEADSSAYMMNVLKKRWEIDDYNIFETQTLINYTALWQLIRRPEFADKTPPTTPSILPLGMTHQSNIFDLVRERDILLHHPYNNFEPVLQLLEQAAEDPAVLAIKLTIYRLAKNSRVTAALLKAAESGKHVSVLFEIKARFDEENNIREAERLQRAGCFVIYGIGWLKTHTKLMLIVRNEGQEVMQYAHLATGNYNEETAKLYTDIGLLTTDEVYTRDISEFFNVITGHSEPQHYNNLITSPRDMRSQLIELIRKEASNAKLGLPSGICLKINSLEDKAVIDELYIASQAGVQIKLIVRGICCLRPQRVGLSENIRVLSIVGNYLEHTRLFYFHNAGNTTIYGGSADVMVRSFDRRIESLFLLDDEQVKQQVIHILSMNLRDNTNAYELHEDGNYTAVEPNGKEIDIHQTFFEVDMKAVAKAKVFT